MADYFEVVFILLAQKLENAKSLQLEHNIPRRDGDEGTYSYIFIFNSPVTWMYLWRVFQITYTEVAYFSTIMIA